MSLELMNVHRPKSPVFIVNEIILREATSKYPFSSFLMLHVAVSLYDIELLISIRLVFVYPS